MKGVSTVIATLLLLVIAIGLTGTAGYFLFNMFGQQTRILLEVDEQATWCNNNQITVYVRNEGTQTLTADKVMVSGVMANGTNIPSTACGLSTLQIVGGGAAVACSAVPGSSGSNNILVNAPSSSARRTITCA